MDAAQHARNQIAAGLRRRRRELEEALLTRIYGIHESVDVDPEYRHGLRAAVVATVDYAVALVESGEEQAPPIPAVFLLQSRLAARNGVPLEVVMRRYFSGFMLLSDFVLAEVDAVGSQRGPSLHRLLVSHGAHLDQLVDTISQEYNRELASHAKIRSSQEWRTERVRRLLAGEELDLGDFGYDLTGWHVGLIVTGERAGSVLAELAGVLQRRLLHVFAEEIVAWAWLGARERFDAAEVARQAETLCSPGQRLAVGEPGRGVGGWRDTHRQALAAIPLIGNRSGNVIRYRDVALIGAVLSDEVLGRFLQQRYLDPLADERDGGEAFRRTLAAYLSAGQNISSAAAALGVNRQTVRKRLDAIEERLGSTVTACATEAEIALRLHHYERAGTPRT